MEIDVATAADLLSRVLWVAAGWLTAIAVAGMMSGGKGE